MRLSQLFKNVYYTFEDLDTLEHAPTVWTNNSVNSVNFQSQYRTYYHDFKPEQHPIVYEKLRSIIEMTTQNITLSSNQNISKAALYSPEVYTQNYSTKSYPYKNEPTDMVLEVLIEAEEELYEQRIQFIRESFSRLFSDYLGTQELLDTDTIKEASFTYSYRSENFVHSAGVLINTTSPLDYFDTIEQVKQFSDSFKYEDGGYKFKSTIQLQQEDITSEFQQDMKYIIDKYMVDPLSITFPEYTLEEGMSNIKSEYFGSQGGTLKISIPVNM